VLADVNKKDLFLFSLFFLGGVGFEYCYLFSFTFYLLCAYCWCFVVPSSPPPISMGSFAVKAAGKCVTTL